MTRDVVDDTRRIEELETEVARLQGIVDGLAARVVKQSELLSRKAEVPAHHKALFEWCRDFVQESKGNVPTLAQLWRLARAAEAFVEAEKG